MARGRKKNNEENLESLQVELEKANTRLAHEMNIVNELKDTIKTLEDKIQKIKEEEYINSIKSIMQENGIESVEELKEMLETLNNSKDNSNNEEQTA